jgi:hypothetical protein
MCVYGGDFPPVLQNGGRPARPLPGQKQAGQPGPEQAQSRTFCLGAPPLSPRVTAIGWLGRVPFPPCYGQRKGRIWRFHHGSGDPLPQPWTSPCPPAQAPVDSRKRYGLDHRFPHPGYPILYRQDQTASIKCPYGVDQKAPPTPPAGKVEKATEGRSVLRWKGTGPFPPRRRSSASLPEWIPVASFLGAPDDAAISYQHRALTVQAGKRLKARSPPVIAPPVPPGGVTPWGREGRGLEPSKTDSGASL